jgi:hypothetical protein
MPENDARCTASGASRAPTAGSAPPSALQSCARTTSSGRCRPAWHQPQPPPYRSPYPSLYCTPLPTEPIPCRAALLQPPVQCGQEPAPLGALSG